MTEPVGTPLRLPAIAESISMARSFVVGLPLGLDDNRVADLELLVSEVVTNAVQHSEGFTSAEGSEPAIVVNVYRTPGGIRVEVHDADPAHPLPVDEPEDAEHGWGLQLISNLSSSWGIRPATDGSGKAVWFEIDRPT